MSEYAKSIQTINDLWKKRIELRDKGGRQMSDEKPCPFCGDESEYLRFLDLCAERANEKWRENEVKTMIDVYTSMDFVQVVRCRDCKHFTPQGTHKFENGKTNKDCCYYVRGYVLQINPDGFCAWGERREQ